MAKGKTTFRVLKEVAERPMEEEIEEKVEEQDEKTTVTIISNKIKQYMHQEHILDDLKMKANGFIGRATTRARLRGFTAKPKNIYPVAVTKFFDFLDTEKLTTKVSCVDPQTRKTYMATVDKGKS